ncbi:MAG: glucose-6-phosphate isomerase [Bacteroidales bacterium]|nr:glucose-6-phosphate isomerase [Bacteroidales bacterium]
MTKKNINFSSKLVENFITYNDFNISLQQAEQGRQTLLDATGAGNDFLGWVHLPSSLDTEVLQRIHSDVARLKDRCSLFVIIGIGGSYLGARAVIEALQSEFEAMRSKRSFPYIIYAGHTLSEEYYSQLLPILDSNDYGVAVISKSGTTTEPAVAFRIIKHHIEQKYGKEEARQRIIAITDAQRGALHTMAQQEGYSSYVIPDNVGGRFSVLTPVGLLPIAMAGYNIDNLLAGARKAESLYTLLPADENAALQYAATRNALYNKGYKVEMLTNFIPSLRYISEWWKQLYGESEGKEHKGILPHSLCFTTDLHSMGQYMQDGERMIMETVISVASAKAKVAIPHDEQDLDNVNYLEKKSLNEINHCAEQGTIEAHHDGGVPVMKIELEQIDEETLGHLLYFFEFACGVSGYMLGVNPFNQPGVEAYKKNMFRLLGKK